MIDERQDIEEMTQEEILQTEDQILAGMMEAANFKEDTKKIEIRRKGKLLFSFNIRPMTEEELQDCRKRSTKYVPHPMGKHLPKIEGEIDLVKLRSLKIYTATTEEDKKLWNNPQLKKQLNVITYIDVIDSVLLAGEKDAIDDVINDISGYGKTLDKEEYVKNSSGQADDSI